MQVATFDIGTTAVKCVVVKDDGTAVYTDSAGVRTIEEGNYREQAPEEWYEAFCLISERIFKEIPAAEIDAIIFSGQMQDVIPVDASGMAVRNAILYSDGRAQAQAGKIILAVGRQTDAESVVPAAGTVEDGGESGTPGEKHGYGGKDDGDREEAQRRGGVKRISEITGNHFDGSMPLAKILWLKENEPKSYERSAAFLISSKDYLIAKLTGNFVGDMTACSTAGAMDLFGKTWSEELIRAAGLDLKKFPKLLYSHEIAGEVTEAAAKATGYCPGTKVYAGTGDAGATTLASGILREGEYNINLGTSSWVAAVSGGCMECEGGGFNLAAMQTGKYINVVPFLNGGNVHKFLARTFSRAEGGEPDYSYISELLAESEAGSHGVLFLPYLTGERFPVMDENIRGCYLGLGQETTAADMARSALEGVACSIRQGLELFQDPAEKITLIGGGAREAGWCRILSSIMGKELYVYQNPDLLPALAIASSVFLAEGQITDYREFIQGLESRGYCTVCEPEPGTKELYDGIYDKYKKIYPMVKTFYESGNKE